MNTRTANACLKRNYRREWRWGSRFMSRPPSGSPWSLWDLYTRPTRWAVVFRHRMAGERVEASMRRYRNELLDCISLSSTP